MQLAGHTVIYGVAGQLLRHVAPRLVASATYEITDIRKAQGDPDRIIASGAATVPAYTLTLVAEAGPSEPDPQRLDVDTTIGPEVDDVIEIEDPDGAREALAVAGKGPGSLRVASWIARPYAAGSTVRGLVLTAPVPADLYSFTAALDDQRPLRVLWSYAIGTEQIEATEPIELRRQTEAALPTGAAQALVRDRWPDLPLRLGEAQTLEQLARACAVELEADLLARSIDPASLMLGRQGQALLASKIVYEAAVSGWQPGQRDLAEFVAERLGAYTRRLDAIAVGRAGAETIALDLDARAESNPDSTYRGPIWAA